MKRFINVVIALLAISLLVSCGNLSLAGKNANLPSKTGKGIIGIRVDHVISRAASLPIQDDITKYQVAVYTSDEQKVAFSDEDITPEEMAAGINASVAVGKYGVSVNALRGDEVIFRGVSEEVEVKDENTKENPATADVQMYQVLAVYDKGTERETCLWEKLMTDEDAKHPLWFIPSIEDVGDSWKINDKEVIGWVDTATGLEYDAGDKIWLSGKTLPLHLEAIWAEPDTAAPIVKLIEFFTHDGSILSAEQKSFAITSEKLAEDGTFELPIEDLTKSMNYWGRDYLPEGTTFVGWKDAAGKLWTLSETMSVEDLPDELPLKLYAQWDLPARVSYWFNDNYDEDSDSIEFPGREGNAISLNDFLDCYYDSDEPDISEYYNRAFIGCSVNKRFPIIDSDETYNEVIAELKNTDFLKAGDSYELTNDTTFYAIWADFDYLKPAQAYQVNYCLGEENRGYAIKTFYYLKELMDYDEAEEIFKLPLPAVNAVLPAWDETPSGTTKANEWKDDEGNIRYPGEILEIPASEDTVYLWSEIKVPVIQYWDGGSIYGGENHNADSIMSDPDMEDFVYIKTWPLPPSNAYYVIDLWVPELADYKGTPFASSLSQETEWIFTGWYDEEEGEILESPSPKINLASHENFPIKLEARWKPDIDIQSGSSFTAYPDGNEMPSTIYYAKEFKDTRYVAFKGLETPSVNGDFIQIADHSRSFNKMCFTNASAICNGTQSTFAMNGYLMLDVDSLDVSEDYKLIFNVVDESGDVVAERVVIQYVTRDGVYVKYTVENTTYDCFLFTPRGMYKYSIGHYTSENRMSSQIVCSGDENVLFISAYIQQINDWE